MTEVGTYESSTFSGRPIQLYEFIRMGQFQQFYWRFNTSDRNLVYYDDLHYAVPISDSGVKLSSEASSTDLDVTMPIDTNFVEQFRLGGTVPSDSVWLRIRRAHADQIVVVDGIGHITTDALVIWVGSVNGVTQTDDLTAKVSCSMLSASFKRGGLRYGYQRTCPHVLYARNTCKVDREAFIARGVITAIEGNLLAANEWALKPASWFAGGFIEYTVPSGMIERRMVLEHNGPFLRIHGLPAQMRVGDIVAAFPGCDRTIDHCLNKFNNLPNNGSFPHTPGRNPFDGMPVF